MVNLGEAARDLQMLADARIKFHAGPYTKVLFDDIALAAIEPEHTEYRYNDANELENFVTNIAPAEKFTYDEWGRTITKSRVDGATTYEAVYRYRYGDKLKRVDSTFPNEKDVAYVCDGLGKRRIKSVDPDGTPEKTLYRWAGWSVLAEYGEYTGQGGEWNTFGDRTRSWLGASEVLGSNPQTGTYQYALTDHLGSVRQMRGQDKTLLARHAYYPYGTTLSTVGLPFNRGFTGHQWEPETGQYFAPFRYYNPSAARWTIRDPLGYVDGTNMYGYVGGNPVNQTDPLGLRSWGLFALCMLGADGDGPPKQRGEFPLVPALAAAGFVGYKVKKFADSRASRLLNIGRGIFGKRKLFAKIGRKALGKALTSAVPIAGTLVALGILGWEAYKCGNKHLKD